MKKRMNKKEQGFTLIEVLVAITIFSIGLLAVVSMQVTSIKGNSYSRRMTEGSNLALGKFEELSGLDYYDSDLAAGDHTALDGGDYTITWTVADANPLPNTKNIQIFVRWSEKGTNKQVSLTTCKADII